MTADAAEQRAREWKPPEEAELIWNAGKDLYKKLEVMFTQMSPLPAKEILWEIIRSINAYGSLEYERGAEKAEFWKSTAEKTGQLVVQAEAERDAALAAKQSEYERGRKDEREGQMSEPKLDPSNVITDGFDAWWAKDGRYFDPDTSDVPWFDKRKDLAEYAYRRGKLVTTRWASAYQPNASPEQEFMSHLKNCTRCGHPADWHRADDAQNIPATSPHLTFRCIGYDCEKPGPVPKGGHACDCPDYERHVLPSDETPAEAEERGRRKGLEENEVERMIRTLSGQLLFVTEYIQDRTYGTDENRVFAAEACGQIARDGHRLLRAIRQRLSAKPTECTCQEFAVHFAVHKDCPVHGWTFEERKANLAEALAKNPLQPTPSAKPEDSEGK